MKQLCSPGTPAPWDSRKLIYWSLCPWWKSSKPTYILCVHVSPCFRSQPRLSEGVPGADISQLPVGAGRGAPAAAVSGQQLRLQLRLRAGAMTAGGWTWTAEPGASRQDRGAAGPLCTHHLPWKLMPTSSSRGAADAGTWRGGFPEAEAKSLFIYFAVPFVDMFRKEGVGGLGGGRKGDTSVL